MTIVADFNPGGVIHSLLSLIYTRRILPCEANFSSRMREKYVQKWRLENLQRIRKPFLFFGCEFFKFRICSEFPGEKFVAKNSLRAKNSSRVNQALIFWFIGLYYIYAIFISVLKRTILKMMIAIAYWKFCISNTVFHHES